MSWRGARLAGNASFVFTSSKIGAAGLSSSIALSETNMKKKFKWPLKKLLIKGFLNLTYQRNRLDLPPDLNFQNPQTWEHQNHNWIQTPFLYDNFQKKWSRPSKIFQLFRFQPFQPSSWFLFTNRWFLNTELSEMNTLFSKKAKIILPAKTNQKI